MGSQAKIAEIHNKGSESFEVITTIASGDPENPRRDSVVFEPGERRTLEFDTIQVMTGNVFPSSGTGD